MPKNTNSRKGRSRQKMTTNVFDLSLFSSYSLILVVAVVDCCYGLSILGCVLNVFIR